MVDIAIDVVRANSGNGIVGGLVGDVAGVSSNGVEAWVLFTTSKVEEADNGLVRDVSE